MEMQMEVTSRETIEPSSPTPHRLKTFDLCLLDQMSPMHHAPVVFFYPNDPTRDLSLKFERISCTLKKSLSEDLTRLYPLTGRLGKNNLYIDCNDAGVLLLDKFVALHGVLTGLEEEAFLLGIQVNLLSCGGIVIGASGLHKATGRPDQAMQADCTAASTLFPSSNTIPTNARMWLGNHFTKLGKCRSGRFVFDSAALSKLKLEARSESVPNPTRMEALTGFIWKHAIRASRMLSGMQPLSAVVLPVNLRRRVEPPLPECSIGNIAWKAFATYENTGPEVELRDLVESVRESFAKIDGDYVKTIRGDAAFAGISKWLEAAGRVYSKTRRVCYTFVSWCKVGFYDVEFGWGRPRWVSVGNIWDDAFKNMVIMIDVPSGYGIEAVIGLEDQEMSILDKDQEFLAFAKPQLNMVLHWRSKL
ncbi:hypothetical protein BT93_H0133 [Corymbia citriodora subsp. variegata]|nr:hypothetical protein BT93_H0133 [Corymbia citriodora subsp. variegata]